ncbi:MAG TPA: SDR family NAD(P)-dependent oxidoreductase, partial [Acidimicrobiales bacterium]|nr:SDR family NAD(P)-dependent oxidoreductase [Acidimicrobiales bacterium]
MTLEGRVAVVTGASSGIGRRAAEVLHAAGAVVVVAARRRERLDELAARLGDRVHPAPCDVRASGDVESVFDIARRLGGADVVVAAAGISDGEPAETESRERFADVVDVNLVATFDVAAAAARQMLPKQAGSIVLVTSMFGLVASTPVRAAAYAASKGGL